jgi:protein-tyrosine kinase
LSIVEKTLEKMRHRAESAVADAFAAPKPVRGETSVVQRAVVEPVPAWTPKRQIAVPHERFTIDGILPDAEVRSSVREELRRAKWPLLARLRPTSEPASARSGAWMVTSALAGEGKTVTSINLALSLTLERDAQVLLIDADVPKSHLSELFGLRHEPGLTDALSDHNIAPDSLIVGTDVPGLMLLPAGRIQGNAPELFDSERMGTMIDRLLGDRRERILLFDSSPLLLTNESQVLSRHMGQIILVVGADLTPQPAVMEAIELLGNERPVSCILNQVRRGPLSRYQLGYYGNYYDQTKKEAQ